MHEYECFALLHLRIALCGNGVYTKVETRGHVRMYLGCETDSQRTREMTYCITWFVVGYVDTYDPRYEYKA